jgi:hypothetical protein
MKIIKDNIELIFWAGGLSYLYFINVGEIHFQFCPLSLLGIQFCPGCGIGKSISYLLNFNLIKSFNAHPFGVAALIIITNRILTLIKIQRKVI